MTETPGPDAAAMPGPDVAVEVANLAYDEAFAELQRVVASLEAGGAPLEVTLAQYERAVALQRHCERLLADAELRVQQLMTRPGGTPEAVDVRPEDAEEE